ncbi:long-chain fatty acid--CoA ligase [Rhodococcus fascians]|nr:long-chain fatty acid--CoA ligase [Rhodococcus fascians]MBY4237884.1 long-chain fatty acid--CoA ligase [Rhodococcus fascians]MBY4253365.1 long-chain fatty acid--CoA ligase [Rhodococcus fascians]MBY4269002.1 long-chain fatty acid--CoA ligase [Rhodococcus fascians]MBY4275055.1 long-chain fatty acid--CoA ligase [Rhodococcus fascians]
MTTGIDLGHWFAARTVRSNTRIALTFEGISYTYAGLQQRIDRVAAGLRSHGITPGDRVAFLGANQPAFFEVLLASARVGATFVPLNTRLTGPELAFIVADATPRVLIADTAHVPVVATIRDEFDDVDCVHVESTQSGWGSYEALAATAGSLDSATTVDPDDTAIIMYTSGTTGRPKGVMLSHANLWWNNINLLGQFDVLEDDITLVVAPLFHIAGLNVTTFTTWMKGGHVLLHRQFDPNVVLEDIEKYSVTTMFGVPAMFTALDLHPRFESADLSTLRLVICGGAPSPEPLLRRYADRGIGMMQGYGLTESSPSATFLGAEHALSKLGSAGKPPLYTQVKLLGGDGVAVTTALDRGEICLRGPNITTGYWNRPDATAEAIDADGWFHTGDVGYFDTDGFLFVVDRIKDMIITGGENVYPAEVESVLYGHPDITEVAVVGLPDERWGEAVTAILALREGAALSLEGLRDFGGATLARYKLPTRMYRSDALPRNPSGKILKNELRSHYGA